MAIDVTAEVRIERPRRTVARFMFDPQNDAIWTNGVIESRPLDPGLLARGKRVERTSKFLGRRFSYVIEVVENEEERFVEMETNEPFEMRVRYELEDDGAATCARIRARGGGTGFFSLAGPLLSRMVRRSIQNDLETLKEYLESGASEPD
jgi:polyketide cyclase/dehydrase/lipid transport protein